MRYLEDRYTLLGSITGIFAIPGIHASLAPLSKPDSGKRQSQVPKPSSLQISRFKNPPSRSGIEYDSVICSSSACILVRVNTMGEAVYSEAPDELRPWLATFKYAFI